MQVPELTDDAVVELAREGGVAFITKLSGHRTNPHATHKEAHPHPRGSKHEQAVPPRPPPPPRRLAV